MTAATMADVVRNSVFGKVMTAATATSSAMIASCTMAGARSGLWTPDHGLNASATSACVAREHEQQRLDLPAVLLNERNAGQPHESGVRR